MNIVVSDLVICTVWTSGQSLQMKHLDRVWNFKWKVCGGKLKKTFKRSHKPFEMFFLLCC